MFHVGVCLVVQCVRRVLLIAPCWILREDRRQIRVASLFYQLRFGRLEQSLKHEFLFLLLGILTSLGKRNALKQIDPGHGDCLLTHFRRWWSLEKQWLLGPNSHLPTLGLKRRFRGLLGQGFDLFVQHNHGHHLLLAELALCPQVAPFQENLFPSLLSDRNLVEGLLRDGVRHLRHLLGPA